MYEQQTPVVFRRGKLVILRPLRKEDAPQLAAGMNDPDTTQYLNRRFPMSIQEEEKWIANIPNRIQTDVVLGIEAVAGPLIGTIGLHRIDWTSRRASTGTAIYDEKYRGKGYGTDAKMLILDFAFNQLNLYKVCSCVHAFNTRSVRYSEKCGYVVEGVLKAHNFLNGAYHDEIHMAVFREPWLPLWEKYRKEL